MVKRSTKREVTLNRAVMERLVAEAGAIRGTWDNVQGARQTAQQLGTAAKGLGKKGPKDPSDKQSVTSRIFGNQQAAVPGETPYERAARLAGNLKSAVNHADGALGGALQQVDGVAGRVTSTTGAARGVRSSLNGTVGTARNLFTQNSSFLQAVRDFNADYKKATKGHRMTFGDKKWVKVDAELAHQVAIALDDLTRPGQSLDGFKSIPLLGKLIAPALWVHRVASNKLLQRAIPPLHAPASLGKRILGGIDTSLMFNRIPNVLNHIGQLAQGAGYSWPYQTLTSRGTAASLESVDAVDYRTFGKGGRSGERPTTPTPSYQLPAAVETSPFDVNAVSSGIGGRTSRGTLALESMSQGL